MNDDAEYALDEALDRLNEAEDRLRMVGVMAGDILIDLHRGEDVRPQLDALLDLMLACRRSMSQSAGWVDATIQAIDRERRSDHADAGTERQG